MNFKDEKQLREKIEEEIDLKFEDKQIFFGEDFKDFVNDIGEGNLFSYDIVSRITEDGCDYWEEARTGLNINNCFCSVIFDYDAGLKIELNKEEFIKRLLSFEKRARQVLLDIKNGNVEIGDVLELK